MNKPLLPIAFLFVLLGLGNCFSPAIQPYTGVRVRVRGSNPERVVERFYAVGRDSARAARVSPTADSTAFELLLNLAADSTAYVLVSPTRVLDTLTIFYRRQAAFNASSCRRDYYLTIVPPDRPATDYARAARGTVENVQFSRSSITLDYRP
jgi:hypothetical protein